MIIKNRQKPLKITTKTIVFCLLDILKTIFSPAALENMQRKEILVCSHFSSIPPRLLHHPPGTPSPEFQIARRSAKEFQASRASSESPGLPSTRPSNSATNIRELEPCRQGIPGGEAEAKRYIFNHVKIQSFFNRVRHKG